MGLLPERLNGLRDNGGQSFKIGHSDQALYPDGSRESVFCPYKERTWGGWGDGSVGNVLARQV